MALTKVTGHVIKSDTNIISHNINSSGIITAVTFDGNVSGVAVTFTGDSTIGSLGITTNLTVGGNIDVDGHTELDNVNIAGVVTATDLTVEKSGNLNVNIKSTGGWGALEVGGATAGYIDIKKPFSDDYDLRFMVDGSGTNYITSNAAPLKLNAQGATGIELGAYGAASLKYNNNTKLSITNTGAVVSGILTVTGNMNVEGVLTYQDVTNIDSIGIITARSNIDCNGSLDVDGHTDLDNVSIAGVTTMSGNLQITDATLSVTSAAPEIFLTDTNANSDYSIVVNGGQFRVRDETNSANRLAVNSDGHVDIYGRLDAVGGFVASSNSSIEGNLELTSTYPSLTWTDTNHNSDFRITNNDGTLIVYDITRSAHVLDFKPTGDLHVRNDKGIYFGESNDLLIGHDGTSTRIEDAYGFLAIKSNSLELQTYTGGEVYAKFTRNGAVELRYDNAIKLTTSDTGISVTGEVAASQDYPLVKPVLDFNFAVEKKLDPRIQFTRTSIATFVDKKGIVQYVSDNQPRFDHHPTSGVSLGLLLEQQSINYQPYSVDMSQGANNNGVTVENNAAIAPDGTMSASKITGGTNQNTSQRLGWGTQGVNSSNFTMWSIWLKSEETSCIIQIYSNTYTFGSDVLTVELADGTVGGHTTVDANFRYNLEKYPNKWWRLSWGGNGNAGGNSGGMYVAVVPAMNSARAANTGSTGKVWYAWGLQEEVGTQTRFATSYIPTNGASVTRTADRGTIDGDDFDDFFDRYQGAVVHETSNAIHSWTYGGAGWEFNNDNYQYNVITNISSGYAHNSYPGGYAVANGENSDSGTNSSSLFGPSSATGNAPTNGGYNAGRVPNSSTVDYNRLYKTYTDGMSWDISGSTNTLVAATGGFSASGTNTNNISFRNISKFELGSDATDMDGSYQKFSGRIKRWMYYDKALTANQLENVTAQDPVTYL